MIQPERGQARTLLLYRIGILATLLATLGLGLTTLRLSKDMEHRDTLLSKVTEARQAQQRPPGPRVEVTIHDLGVRFEQLRQAYEDSADISQSFFDGKLSSVHMHIMGYQQICPLHVHPKSEEVTVLVEGQAEVLQVYPEGGALREVTHTFGPGSLIASPPNCGHEFRNQDAKKMLGNLVFAMPLFTGNFYVGRKDPRLLRGAPPFHYRPEVELAAFTKDTAPYRRTQLPVFGGRMSTLLVRGEYTLPERAPRQATIFYVFAGTGQLRDPEPEGGAAFASLRPQQLIIINPYGGSAGAVRVRAEPGQILSLLLFIPDPLPPPAPQPG